MVYAIVYYIEVELYPTNRYSSRQHLLHSFGEHLPVPYVIDHNLGYILKSKYIINNKNMKSLEGKVAVVTGGNSGIGLAAAQQFVLEGAHVFITGRRQSELDTAVKQIGKNVSSVQGDISHLVDLDRLYAKVKEQKGNIDILFANAGVGEFALLGTITEAQFDKTFGINVKGLLFTVQKALPMFQDSGSIILNASIGGSKGDRSDISLQRNQSRHTIICSHLGSRAQTSQDPSQCYKSWSY